MKRWKRMLAGGLCTAMAIALAGCGESGSADADVSISMWIFSSMDGEDYTEYEENPVVQYTLEKTWGPENKKLAIDYWTPAPGSENDNYQTMISSGDLPDVLDATVADTPITMFENGNILDITDYVKEYMPNYLSFLEKNPDVKASAIDIIDGEEHYLQICSGFDALDYYYFGYEYRRDWIVKYGKNPVTGEAFTGGYADPADPDSWEDNVVFPSGGSDPVYISDWEWMFEIFQAAQADLGIKDSYCLSMYYPGYTWSGGLCSCFGGGIPVWYVDAQNRVKFGGDSEQFRTYLQCLNTWYEKGWLDHDFYQRTGDNFYAIDDTSVRQGKVGMWMGLEGQFGKRMDMGDELTSDICVYGCAYPINDIYGSDACRNVEPDCVQSSSMIGTKYYITKTAADKDLATILSYFDYFYTEEGALLRTLGLNAQQVAERNDSLYQKWGLEDGAYTVGEDGSYIRSEVINNDSGVLGDACRISKIPGITLIENVDKGYAVSYEHSLATWIQYKNAGSIMGSAITEKMSTEDSKIFTNSLSKVLEWLEKNTADMIRGLKDPYSDDDWATWCKTLQKYNYESIIDVCQPYADKYQIR